MHLDAANMVTLWKQFEAKMSALLPMPRCVSRDSPELCQAVEVSVCAVSIFDEQVYRAVERDHFNMH
ncbi:hypothetical protein T4A_12518 [Trichinella pseudospiralis]|uniref:Uncharacterized protein n=1 Tax=Trichinella pseudospiralis TaxID=6337 RepID=A0A0V1J232_TRIPS|nr:hypothetical protein T4A_12518 [Trichinella pseudospiralis]KRY82652.1 hypothetical protein T4D_15134 [Trichinella pseudospiralis]KRZ29019.1 hypothetical protein T4C_10472 [Trichinella pseudospiralis]